MPIKDAAAQVGATPRQLVGWLKGPPKDPCLIRQRGHYRVNVALFEKRARREGWHPALALEEPPT